MSLIRLATVHDAAQIQAIYAPFCGESSPVSFEVEPPSEKSMGERIAKTLLQYPWLVCERGETILGYVYAGTHNERSAYRWSVSVAVYIREDQRGTGVGRALYTSLFNALRFQGYFNAYAGITLPNPGSLRLHQAMGFELVGTYREVGYKGGSWHDVSWWQLPLRERMRAPESPLSVQVARNQPEWDAALASGLPLLRPGQIR